MSERNKLETLRRKAQRAAVARMWEPVPDRPAASLSGHMVKRGAHMPLGWIAQP